MRFWVGVTDGDWYRSLAAQPGIDEVNFWQPSGGREFRTLAPGDLFLFKLHAPVNAIVGGGVFAHETRGPAGCLPRDPENKSMSRRKFKPGNGLQVALFSQAVENTGPLAQVDTATLSPLTTEREGTTD